MSSNTLPITPALVQEETLSQQRLHEGRVINLRVDSVKNAFGQTVVREVVEHPGGVCVLPLLPDGRFVLVRQYRYPTGQFLLEFPAGKLDVKGEPPFEAIQRELLEETGYTSASWQALGTIYTAPGFCNEKIYLYQATGLQLAPNRLGPQEDEALEPVLMSEAEVRQAMAAFEIQDGKTLALLAYYFTNRSA
jgi:ADP-ribose pyrophosphatase